MDGFQIIRCAVGEVHLHLWLKPKLLSPGATRSGLANSRRFPSCSKPSKRRASGRGRCPPVRGRLGEVVGIALQVLPAALGTACAERLWLGRWLVSLSSISFRESVPDWIWRPNRNAVMKPVKPVHGVAKGRQMPDICKRWRVRSEGVTVAPTSAAFGSARNPFGGRDGCIRRTITSYSACDVPLARLASACPYY